LKIKKKINNKKINVTVAGLQGAQPLVCSRNVVIKPDVALDDISDKVNI